LVLWKTTYWEELNSVAQNSTGPQLEIVSSTYRARVSNDGQIVVDNRDDIQLFDLQTQTTENQEGSG